MMIKELQSADRCASNHFVIPMKTDDIIEKIKSAFDDGFKNIVLSGDNKHSKTVSCLQYARMDSCSCNRVIYAVFDREKYLCNNLSIDAVLKKCLVNHLVANDATLECENYLKKFEECLDENTLLIIDNYEIGAPSPYMRHLFSLDCKVIVITGCEMNNVGENATRIDVCDKNLSEPDFMMLDSDSRELLMSLCGMLCYLDDGIPIQSSKNGVFDEESVRFYLSGLADKLPYLYENGFVKYKEDGAIFIEPHICDRVMNDLCPSADNCPSFMSFVSGNLDFNIMQCSKDFKAKLSVEDDKNIPFYAFEEILCAYTHFSQTDALKGKRIYNLLISLMLDRLAFCRANNYSTHHLFRNSAYYLKTLSKCLEDESLCRELYDERLYTFDVLPEFYSYTVRAKLDIIRLCVMYLMNLTTDLYDFAHFAFEMLYDSMEYLYENEIEHDENIMKKLLLSDDVIRLCDETFSYFEPVDENGEYKPFRDSIKYHRIRYSGEKHCDELYADSCAFGYSVLTVKLYGMYQKYIDMWLYLCRENTSFSNKLLSAYYDEKKDVRSRKSKAISMQFSRVVNGYENIIPTFIPEGETAIKVYEFNQDESFEKRLSDNKRYLKRGFDGGTKRSAKRYAELVLSAIIHGSDILKTLTCVLDYDYPLSDNTYAYLLSSDFVNLVVNDENTANLTKQILLENLVYNYRAFSQKQNLTLLYESLISSLIANVSQNETSTSRLCSAASDSFLVNKMHCDECDFVTELYERICLASDVNEEFAHELLANVLYKFENGIESGCCTDTILKAIKSYCVSLVMKGSTEDAEAVVHLCEKILSEKQDEIENLLKELKTK